MPGGDAVAAPQQQARSSLAPHAGGWLGWLQQRWHWMGYQRWAAATPASSRTLYAAAAAAAADAAPGAASTTQQQRGSGAAGVAPTHLIVMVNGLFGNASNWDVVCEHLGQALPRDTLLHPSQVNTRFATYHGIDACGQRLADEVRGLVAVTPSLSRVSIIAHSMGGLMARYAIGVLYNPATGRLAGLKPSHFVSMATPHCGCDADGVAQVPFIGWSGNLPLLGQQLYRLLADISGVTAGLIFQATGRQFFLLDGTPAGAATTTTTTTSGGGGGGGTDGSAAAAAADGGTGSDQAGSTAHLPLLQQLSQDCPDRGLFFYSGLAAFQTRTAYANMDGDHLVGFANSSLRSLQQLPPPPPDARSAKGVVREDSLSAAFWPGAWRSLQDQWAASRPNITSTSTAPSSAAAPDTASASEAPAAPATATATTATAAAAAIQQPYKPSRVYSSNGAQQGAGGAAGQAGGSGGGSAVWHEITASSGSSSGQLAPAAGGGGGGGGRLLGLQPGRAAGGLLQLSSSPASGQQQQQQQVRTQHSGAAGLGSLAADSGDDLVSLGSLAQPVDPLPPLTRQRQPGSPHRGGSAVAAAEVDLASGLAGPGAAAAANADAAAADVAADAAALMAAGAGAGAGGPAPATAAAGSSSRAEAVAHMLARLQELPWRRIDVSFQGAKFGFAHNNIQVTRRWMNWEGVAVPQHVAEQLQLMDTLLMDAGDDAGQEPPGHGAEQPTQQPGVKAAPAANGVPPGDAPELAAA